MKSYSADLRERIIKARENGHSVAETAKRYAVSARTVERYWKRFEQTGQYAPLQRGGYRVSMLRPHLKTLRRWIEKQNDLTLAEMMTRLQSELGVPVSRNALWYQINKMGLSYKKNAARSRTRTPRRENSPRKLETKPKSNALRKARLHR